MTSSRGNFTGSVGPLSLEMELCVKKRREFLVETKEWEDREREREGWAEKMEAPSLALFLSLARRIISLKRGRSVGRRIGPPSIHPSLDVAHRALSLSRFRSDLSLATHLYHGTLHTLYYHAIYSICSGYNIQTLFWSFMIYYKNCFAAQFEL